MHQVSFRFDREKLVQTLTYFSRRGISDLTKLKAAKLIYFVDKAHLWQYGRPVVGGPYYCMPFGPVPGKALQTMNDVIDSANVELPNPDPDEHSVRDFLAVVADGIHPRFVAKRDFDADAFSRSELAVLARVVDEYGNRSAGELVEITHRDPTWTTPNQVRAFGRRENIPYQLFFEDASTEVRKMWKLIEAEQEDRSTDDCLEPELVS